MDQKKIGAFLKALRKEKELTQDELAQHLHVSSRTVSRWETGSNMPDISLLIEIAEFYDVSIPEIVSGERKNVQMNEETKEVARTLSAYAESEKETIIRNMQLHSLIGLLALIVYAAPDILHLPQTNNLWAIVSDYSLTLIFVMTLLNPLHTFGLMVRIGRKQTYRKLPLPVALPFAALIAFAAAWIIKILLSLLPLG